MFKWFIRTNKINKIALCIWCLGIVLILYFSTFSYERRPSGIYGPSSLEFTIYCCGIFSLYFLGLVLLKLFNTNKPPKWLIYFCGIIIICFEFLVLALGSMHSPPIWFGLWLGILSTIIFHFILLPIIYNTRPPNK